MAGPAPVPSSSAALSPRWGAWLLDWLERAAAWCNRRFDAWARRLPGCEPRLRTPTVLQMEAAECGAAALGSILGHYGRYVPLEELREACGVSRDGSKASNILKAARRYGLVAKGFKYELPALRRAPLPCILYWNFNHFLVLEGFARDGRAFLNDPAAGPRIVTADELDASFTGVALTFEPGPEFRKAGRPPALVPQLVGRLRGYEEPVAFVTLCALLLVIPGLLAPAFTRVFIDDYLIGGKTSWARPLILGMAAAVVFQVALSWLQQRVLLRFQTKLALAASSRFLCHVLRLPVSYFAQRFAGDVANRVQINDTVAQVLTGDFARVMLDLVSVAFFAVLMFLYDPLLAAIGILFASANLVVLRLAARPRADAAARALQEQGKLEGASMNALVMIETLKATGGEDEFFGRWAGYQAKALKARLDLGVIAQVTAAVPPLLSALSIAAILGFGALRIIHGDLTVGTLVAFQILLAGFNAPIHSLVRFGSQLQTLQANLTRLDDVLRYEPDPRYEAALPAAGSAAAGPVRLRGEVELRGVSFGYSRLEPPLIDDFSLHLRPGQRVALVGGSGSGKSTVAKLVSGLYRPWAGEVLFDGKPLQEIAPAVLKNSVGFVDQDVLLFEGTVRDNLTMWDATASDADVHRACHDAAIAQDIAGRPAGFLAPVQEGGSNFSGGQRQRLEIARALVSNPTLLILDEATSALDAATELKVDRAFRRRGCSCLIVAHRLSTIRDADEIVVMDRGRIVERGTYEELQALQGVFCRLMEDA